MLLKARPQLFRNIAQSWVRNHSEEAQLLMAPDCTIPVKDLLTNSKSHTKEQAKLEKWFLKALGRDPVLHPLAKPIDDPSNEKNSNVKIHRFCVKV